MKTIRNILLFGLFFSLPVTSLAWGVLGHRIVGEIANSYLSPKAKMALQKILGTESIAMSSNWADLIRSDTSYRYMNSWHYINLDKGLTEDQLHQLLENDTATNVLTKTNFLIGELKKKGQTLQKKQMYLRLLIHFIGDIHQPLHVGHREDQGGNRIKVSWFNTPSNLHTVWDESLVNFQQLSYTEYTAAINHTTLQQRKAWQKQPIQDWIVESYTLAENVYNGIKEDNQKLSYDYNFTHVSTVNSQLLKGGVRLAGILNQIFG